MNKFDDSSVLQKVLRFLSGNLFLLETGSHLTFSLETACYTIWDPYMSTIMLLNDIVNNIFG